MKSACLKKLRADLKSENTCYHSVQKFSHYPFPYRSVEIKIYRIAILPIILGGHKILFRLSNQVRRGG